MVRESHSKKLTSMCIWKDVKDKLKNGHEDHFDNGNKKLDISIVFRHINSKA